MLPLEAELQFLSQIPIAMKLKKDEDFNLWQCNAKAKLKELLGMNLFKKTDLNICEEYKEEHINFTEIHFSFQSEKGYYVPCILSIPKTENIEKPPLMICLQGHGTGMHISMGKVKYPIDEAKIKTGDRDFAVQCINIGFCALSIEQRNFGERGGNPKPTCHASSMVALLSGRTIIGARVWDISRAIDAVTEKYSDFFDVEKIYCMGNSGGGTATIYASALEERIKGAICSCAFCDFLSSIGEQNHCECNYIPGIRNYFDMAEIAGMSAPKPLVIVSGKTDGIFPLKGAVSEFERLKRIYYSACGKPGNCVHIIGEEGHRFYAKQAWDAFENIILSKEN